ncbi:MAG: hypothetical protein ACAH80_01045 [Alphaproteobacteria bacterium]
MAIDNDSDDLPQQGYLSGAFGRVARRMALTAGLMSLTGGEAVKAMPVKPPTAAAVATAKSVTPPSLTDAERQRRRAIRDTLLQAARKDVPSLQAHASTGYSGQLDVLENTLTSRLQGGDTSVHNKVVFVDPAKMDVALSLGFAPSYALQTLLAQDKIVLPDSQLEMAGDKVASYHESRFGVRTYTQEPTAITNLHNMTSQACVVVPSSEHALDVEIKGLSRAETVEFTNRHESWHCLDSKYNLRHIDPAQLEAIKEGSLRSHLGNTAAFETYATFYKKEALADVGAAGDMIRAGKGLDLIDKTIAWRNEDPKDLQHLTSPVLKGFKHAIEQMGVENFRRLSDADAQKMYFDTVDLCAMTAKSLDITVRFATAPPAQRQKWAKDAETDLDAARALGLLSHIKPAAPAGEKPLTAAEKTVARQLKSFKPGKLLDDKAFELSGKITPATLADAYDDLQEGLRKKMAAEPANKLWQAQATALQQEFLNHARGADFVQLNADRGVDIVQRDASLKDFRTIQTAAKPGASKI